MPAVVEHYSAHRKKCENPDCANVLVFNNQRDVTRKHFCSRQCNGSVMGRKLIADPLFKAKLLAAGQTPEVNAKKGRSGAASAVWKGGKADVTCKRCGKQFKTAPHRIKEGNGKYCSRECYLADHSDGVHKGIRLPFVCQGCGNTAYAIPYWAVRRKFCSRRCNGIHVAAIMSARTGPTWIERWVDAVLTAGGWAFKTQVPLIGKTLVDFLVNDRFVIYTDGTFWHSGPKKKHQD